MRILRSLCQGPVTGVDFSAGMLAQARTAHPDARWVRADVRALPFAGAFDLAVSFGALGHFLPAERPALFAGVHRALRPGGIFAFRSVRRSPSPQAGAGHCSDSTWPCGSVMPCGVPHSSCTTAPARCTRSATT
ncbi:MAG: class I SAM-dependent methyltransferase [Streptosporangiaceae bacterium]